MFWLNSNAAPIYLCQLSDEFSAQPGLQHQDAVPGKHPWLLIRDDKAGFECHAAFWANSTSTPVALASPEANSFTPMSFSPVRASIVREKWLVTPIMPGFAAVRAVSWASSSSPAVVLNTVGELINTVAAGISDNGEIVGNGYNEDFSKMRAFLWRNYTSQGIDLTTFFPAGSNWGLGFHVRRRG